ncbi:hypothetical protein DET65_1764 [Sunxiuqinia elliptica]|uniref:Uncharacterized protein n=1 Tax=Sunxiuqinia elliptica TaxID=655355 RepID=A0A4R6H755_9BACT|nr:hypothetical protein DET52_10288 [Sunxiuqinia elliptica]TDO62038.1 hypothetical protein DET65_1764 [Sunxiuqinia elliptica]
MNAYCQASKLRLFNEREINKKSDKDFGYQKIALIFATAFEAGSRG